MLTPKNHDFLKRFLTLKIFADKGLLLSGTYMLSLVLINTTFSPDNQRRKNIDYYHQTVRNIKNFYVH